jgi:hypothetical protein
MRAMPIVLALALLLIGSPAAADNAPMWESPVGLTPEGATSVQMAAETVNVDVVERGGQPVAVVNAAFDMTNPGPSVELLVGFPNFAYEAINDGTYSPVSFTSAKLTKFKAWTEATTFQPTPRTVDAGRFGGTEWFVWSMAYPQGRTTRVNVSYEQRLGPPAFLEQGAATPFVNVTYVLRTGALWAGAIGDARITFTASGGGGLVGGEQAVELADQRIVWHFTDLKPTFDLEAGYVLAGPWQELQTAELALNAGIPTGGDYLRAARAALAVLGTDGAYLQPPALVSHYAPAMRTWAENATALDSAEAWETLGDTEVYWAKPSMKNHGELACWPDAGAAAYERAAELGSTAAAVKRRGLDETVAFMTGVQATAAPPPCP